MTNEEYLERLHEEPIVKLILWAKNKGYFKIEDALTEYSNLRRENYYFTEENINGWCEITNSIDAAKK